MFNADFFYSATLTKLQLTLVFQCATLTNLPSVLHRHYLSRLLAGRERGAERETGILSMANYRSEHG